MPGEFDARFLFHSEAVDADTLRVIDFTGEEEISQLYRFEINLISDDPELDLAKILAEPAYLEIDRDGEGRRIHGILSEFEQLDRGPVHTYYRAVLVPRMWLLTQSRQNQIYQNMPVAKILEQELKASGLASDDFEIDLQGGADEHPVREYTVQYRETDLNFVSRLMEHEGIFYFFVQEDDKDKLVIADRIEKFPAVDIDGSVVFRPNTGMTLTRECVSSLRCRQHRLPKEVRLKDYNWTTPTLDLDETAAVEDGGCGLVCEYGSYFRNEDEGKALARIRAEEISCRSKLYTGQGNCTAFRAGHLYTLEEHYRPDFDQEYLLIGVRHEGVQTSAGVSGMGPEARDERPSYRNEFTSILADAPFRPLRRARKPKLYGIMNAKIDAAGAGEYAEIDAWGRYKVVLPLDQGVTIQDLAKGDASRWIRMAQPYAGEEYGMHFPLHKGIEVVWACIDGDLDRPIILGAVPNAATRSPVVDENRQKHVIKTSRGVLLEIKE